VGREEKRLEERGRELVSIERNWECAFPARARSRHTLQGTPQRGRVLPSHAGAGVGREAGAGRGGAPNDGGKAVVPFKRRSAPPVCLWLEKGPPGELGNPPKPLVNRHLG
jgi:hypothetical protein